MIVLTLLMSLTFVDLDLIEAKDVPYPPNTVTGGTVLASLSVSAGRVTEVTILEGEEPFVGATRGSISQWRFTDSSDKIRVPVIIHFSRPALFRAGSSSREFRPGENRPAEASLPHLKTLSEPAYPPRSVGNGTAITKIEIDPSGRVKELEVVGRSGGFTQSCLRAVGGWSFLPARDGKGRATSSLAFAVCVFRTPSLPPSPPE